MRELPIPKAGAIYLVSLEVLRALATMHIDRGDVCTPDYEGKDATIANRLIVPE